MLELISVCSVITTICVFFITIIELFAHCTTERMIKRIEEDDKKDKVAENKPLNFNEAHCMAMDIADHFPWVRLRTDVLRKRAKKRMSTEELASQIGVRAEDVERWEHGLSLPTTFLLPQIAHVFGCKVDDLIEYIPPKK